MEKQQKIAASQESPEFPSWFVLIGFNYFPFNCIFKSSPQRFFDLRASPFLFGLETWPGERGDEETEPGLPWNVVVPLKLPGDL